MTFFITKSLKLMFFDSTKKMSDYFFIVGKGFLSKSSDTSVRQKYQKSGWSKVGHLLCQIFPIYAAVIHYFIR